MSTSQKATFHPALWHSCDAGTLRYTIYLATRYNIDPYELFRAFVEAERNGTVTCGQLEITLRRRADDHAIFLLTRRSEVLGQIRVSRMYEDQTNRMSSRIISRARILRRREDTPLPIRELREGIKNVSLRGTVTGKSEMVPTYSRDTGHVTRGCVAIVTDPTGSVRVPLWDNQVNAVSIGDEIEVKNAAVAALRGLLHIIPANEASELVIAKQQRTARTEPATKRSRKRILLHSQNRSQGGDVAMVEAGDCILCKVVDGELPSMKVYDDESFLSILDVTPCAEGHCLVVPKKHITRFYDMGDEQLAHLFRVVKVVARRIRQAFSPDFVCVFIRGGRIPHLHVAVFPSTQGDSLSGFPQSSLGTASVNLPSVAARFRAAATV